uniref:nudix hydrolase 10-like n=1 Tax=Fragaria vesca subsp. vesca TaxID=101020 RepID=UPI0005C9EF03|nr:PREDICTED: nudix hydrolase 10-like [Fragaria vesca subsp. vesca]
MKCENGYNFAKNKKNVKRKELLVVQEKSGRLQGTGVWKIPTGVVDEGEDITVAAVREVKEETGIDAEFQEVLAFRQAHKSFFEKSDLFFVCMLRPLSFDIQKQDLEIEAAKWMSLEEYAAQPVTQKHGIFKCIHELCLAKVKGNYAGFSPLSVKSFFDDQLSYIYLNRQDIQSLTSSDQS